MRFFLHRTQRFHRQEHPAVALGTRIAKTRQLSSPRSGAGLPDRNLPGRVSPIFDCGFPIADLKIENRQSTIANQGIRAVPLRASRALRLNCTVRDACKRGGPLPPTSPCSVRQPARLSCASPAAPQQSAPRRPSLSPALSSAPPAGAPLTWPRAWSRSRRPTSPWPTASPSSSPGRTEPGIPRGSLRSAERGGGKGTIALGAYAPWSERAVTILEERSATQIRWLLVSAM